MDAEAAAVGRDVATIRPMRKGTIALVGTAGVLVAGFGFVVKKPDPLNPLIEAAETATATLEASTAEAVGGSVALVSWLRPGPWRFQRPIVQPGYAHSPLIWVPKGRAVPGAEVKVVVTEGTRYHGTPRQPIWVIGSHETLPEPIDLTPHGMPGCWLELPLTNVVLLSPGNKTVGMCRRIDGAVDRVEFTWTPTPAQVGVRVFVQGIVGAPGANTAGLLLTDAVELVVGPAQ